jgi:adenosylcobyric acid synthase
LRAEPDVDLVLVSPGEALPGDLDLVLLPGSKSTIGDLQAFIEAGWDIDLKAHLRRGGAVLGLCGGYQMLGRRLDDPEGSEGPVGSADGLGLLEVTTRLGGAKTLTEVAGRELVTGEAIRGYEMHIGVTTGAGCDRPMLDLGGRPDGASSADGRVMGCYVHGLFASDAFRHAFLSRLRQRESSGVAYDHLVDGLLDRLADHLSAHVDLDRLWSIAAG